MSYKPQGYNQFENENNPTPAYSDYNQQTMNHQPQVVVQNPVPATFTMDSPTSTFAWCNFIMSVISFFCCNGVFGILGMIYAANSYVSHGEKLFEKSRRQNSLARIFWIISLVIGITIWIIVIAAVAITLKRVKDDATELQSSLNSLNGN